MRYDPVHLLTCISIVDCLALVLPVALRTRTLIVLLYQNLDPSLQCYNVCVVAKVVLMFTHSSCVVFCNRTKPVPDATSGLCCPGWGLRQPGVWMEGDYAPPADFVCARCCCLRFNKMVVVSCD
jgi:hypothetical protein